MTQQYEDAEGAPPGPPAGLWSAPASPPPGRFPTGDPSGRFPAPPYPSGSFPAPNPYAPYPGGPSAVSGYEAYAPPPAVPGGAAPPPPNWSTTAPPGYGPPPSDNRRTVVIGMCALVMVVALALTAFLVVNATSRTAPVAAPIAENTQGEDSASTAGSDPSSSSPSTASAAPALPGSAIVTISSTATSSPSAATVQSLLDRHFGSINAVDYSRWVSTVESTRAAQVSSSSFSEQYATSVDSSVVVSDIASTGSDSAAVSLTFVSNQSLANAPADLQATCIRWSSTWPVSSLSSGGRIGTPGKGSTTRTVC